MTPITATDYHPRWFPLDYMGLCDMDLDDPDLIPEVPKYNIKTFLLQNGYGKKTKRGLKRSEKIKLFIAAYGIDPLQNPKFKFSCPICENKLEWNYFHGGHIISEYNSGTFSLKNMLPICSSCNLQMSKKNMIDYLQDKRYYTNVSGKVSIAKNALSNCVSLFGKIQNYLKTNSDFDP